MFLLRKLRVFWFFNKVKILVIFIVALVFVLMIIGLASMESFYRNLTLAQIPLQIFLTALNAVIFVYFYMTVLRNGFSSMKKGKIKSKNVSVKFSDIIGLDNSKREAMEVVQLLRDRAKVKSIGGKIIKGVLMIGPPGCGKTLMAKGIATESKIPFISMAGSEFVEMFVGVGASRVRKLFQRARQEAYAYGSCIIFIDELDVIGRGRTFSHGGGEETNSTQNQLLVEMDGLSNVKENIVVIGATNAAEGILDAALLRPGRFDRKIHIDRPSLEDREKLFKYYLNKVKCDDGIDVIRLAKQAVYKSPADIENIVKESALIAIRNKKSALDYADMTEAMDRINLGIERRITISDREREMTAYHESGHLLAVYFLHSTHDVFKASIVSRGGALGVVQHQPKEENHTRDKDQLLSDIKVAVAGYAAEKLQYNTTTTGVSSDFKYATSVAHNMVWNYGMGAEDNIGFFDFLSEHKVLSENHKQMLNEEMQKILTMCLNEVSDLLRSEYKILSHFVHELLKKGELEYDEIESIFMEYGKNRDTYINNKFQNTSTTLFPA